MNLSPTIRTNIIFMNHSLHYRPFWMLIEHKTGDFSCCLMKSNEITFTPDLNAYSVAH